MMSAIIDPKNGVVAGVYEKRLTGRFALPNKIRRHLDIEDALVLFVNRRRNR
jgi:hypothetical protein